MLSSEQLENSLSRLPLPLKIGIAIVAMAVYGYLCLLIDHIRFIGLMAVCFLDVWLLSLLSSPSPYLQVVGMTAGGFFTVVSMAAIYLKAGFHYLPDGLKILDWMLIALSVFLMGAFQLFGALPIHYVVIFLAPSVVIRFLIKQLLSRQREKHPSDNPNSVDQI